MSYVEGFDSLYQMRMQRQHELAAQQPRPAPQPASRTVVSPAHRHSASPVPAPLREGFCYKHTDMRLLPKRSYCTLCEEWDQSAFISKDKLWEFTHEHLPGQPSFRTKGQYRSYLKANKLTDDVDVKSLKRMATGRGTPKRDLKQWFRKELAPKYGELMNRSAFQH